MSNPLQYLHDQLEQWRAEGTYQRLRILESERLPQPRATALGGERRQKKS